MEGSEVDLFSADQVVARLLAQIFDVVDEEGVCERMLGKEDDLGTSRRQASCNFSSYA